jgi:hypothetical protein
MEDTITSAAKLRNFRLLWLDKTTSLPGDQFQVVTGAWLMLKMTSDPLDSGTLLGVSAAMREQGEHILQC